MGAAWQAGAECGEDGEVVRAVPHRTLRDLADRATTAETTPKLTGAHIEVLGVVIDAGPVTRGRADELRGVDSAETVAQLIGWALRWEGPKAPAAPSPPGSLRSWARPHWRSCASASSPTPRTA